MYEFGRPTTIFKRNDVDLPNIQADIEHDSISIATAKSLINQRVLTCVLCISEVHVHQKLCAQNDYNINCERPLNVTYLF